MPELPEVETMRRGVEPAIGARVIAVEKLPCPRKPILLKPAFPQLRRRVEGASIVRTARVGKRVVLWLDTTDALVFEPRMAGLLLIGDPPDPLYSRLRLQLRDKTRRAPDHITYWDRRGLGNVSLYTADEFTQKFETGEIGPDALAMTADLYRDRLGQSARAVKVALLDQSAVAGIGNLYASEILYLARIHPTQPCRDLKPRYWTAIAAAALEVLELAIRYEGSTLSDGTYRNALNKEGGYQNKHRVYAKAGERCLRCNRGTIERIVQAQRSTFFCPRCQK